ncbi:Gfo/Idh/MocA family protein [Gorillibacterium massiliense]|uniref:Gfo/Idh/MocA family protein n=1 Tax=Gorillibacterium massiliense TaxID=1280390 RepID=UPI0004AD8A66|nr:Gfo/Idh/MocA family oxidoreductase [Gorillibacterium massiliense]
MDKRKVAIIGLGDIAQKAYLPVITAMDDVEITGIMSRTEETVRRIGSQYRLSGGCTDLKSLLAAGPEAVFIHTATESHFSLVMDCLKEGLHIYVDKPLSYEWKESEAMAEAAYKYGRLLAVGFNRRFAPRYREAKEWLEGAGGIAFAVAQKHRTRLQKHDAAKTVYDDLIHMLDLLLWLMGEQADSRASDADIRVDETGRLLHISGSLAFDGGSGMYAMNRSAGVDLEKLELHGFGRSAEVTNMESADLYSVAEGKRELVFGSWDSVLYRRGFTGAIGHFLAALDHPDDCEFRVDRVLATHRLADHLVSKLHKR